MKKTTLIITIVILVILAVGAVWYFKVSNTGDKVAEIATTTPTSASTSTPVTTATTSSGTKSSATPEIEKPVVLSFPDNHLDTSDWQTYRNEEFGFEVKYPRGWEAVYAKGQCSTAGYGVARVDFTPKDHGPNDDRGTNLCIEAKTLMVKEKELLENNWSVIQRIKVGNVEGIVLSDKRSYILEYGGNIYTFLDTGYTDAAQQILLSFKKI